MLVSQLPGGEWGRGILAGSASPVTLITVAEQARQFRHAIAAYQIEALLRQLAQGEAASNNPVHQQAVFAETEAKFAGTLKPDQIPGLAKILYDGIAKQVRSTVSSLVQHRAVLRGHPTLATQHRNWSHALLAQNQLFLSQIRQAGGQYPERLVRWNKTLLVVETLGLARLIGIDIPTYIADLTAELELAEPLVASIVAGDADELTDRQLTTLAAKTAGVPEDWLAWIPNAQADGARRPAGTVRDTVAEAVAATRPAGSTERSNYEDQLVVANRLRAAGDYKAAARAYGRILDLGGSGDQRVLVGRAVTLETTKPTEAERLAKLGMEIDPTSDLAEEAKAVLNRIGGGKIRAKGAVRPEIVAYLQNATDFILADQEQGKRAWAEAGLLAANGVSDDHEPRYKLTVVDGRLRTGVEIMAWIFAGTQLFAPGHDDGLPQFQPEWALVSIRRGRAGG